jgi:hypothetical protein
MWEGLMCASLHPILEMLVALKIGKIRSIVAAGITKSPVGGDTISLRLYCVIKEYFLASPGQAIPVSEKL